MKLSVKPLLVLSLSAQLLLSTAALADPISFTPDAKNPQSAGNLVGQIPVKSIGSLALPEGLAVFDGHTIEVEAIPDWLFDRDAVLTGAVINSSMTTSGANAIVKGLAYFHAGSWIKNLAPLLARDTIRTVGGGTIVGNVQAVLPDGLEVLNLTGGRQKVAFAEIADIISPRAFRFAASAESLKLDPASTAMQAEPLQIAFAGSGPAGRGSSRRPTVPKSTLAGSEGGIPNSVIASEVLIDVALNVVAPAVAIPLCFGVTRNAQTIAKLKADQLNSGTYGPIYP